jgi:hypothetical protein
MNSNHNFNDFAFGLFLFLQDLPVFFQALLNKHISARFPTKQSELVALFTATTLRLIAGRCRQFHHLMLAPAALQNMNQFQALDTKTPRRESVLPRLTTTLPAEAFLSAIDVAIPTAIHLLPSGGMRTTDTSLLPNVTANQQSPLTERDLAAAPGILPGIIPSRMHLPVMQVVVSPSNLNTPPNGPTTTPVENRSGVPL